MVAEPYVVDIPVPITRYGYFLYVWKVTTAEHDTILYVGRTGDSVYIAANPPIVRVGQHLGRGRGATLTRNLLRRGVNVGDCEELRIVIYGPVFPDAEGDEDAHALRVTAMEALERALRDALVHNGYEVVGIHPRNRDLCLVCWQGVQGAFGDHFDLDLVPPGRVEEPDHPCYRHA